MDFFKNVEYDYQVTSKVEDIDIIRILRENEKDGMQYVFLMTPTVSVLFMKKKFAKRVEKLALFDFIPIVEEAKYGLGNNHGSNYVTGSQIRSVGFTTYKFIATSDVVQFREVLSSIDEIEKKIQDEFDKERKEMSTVKVLAG